MTDDDEGTPYFPTCQSVFGMCAGSVYRSLVRTDDTEDVLIRRLHISSDLRQPRSRIRATARKLWPDITEQGTYAEELDPGYAAIAPASYQEVRRDMWDGNSLWLADDWLWEHCPEKMPDDLRVSRTGAWTTFGEWLRKSADGRRSLRIWVSELCIVNFHDDYLLP